MENEQRGRIALACLVIEVVAEEWYAASLNALRREQHSSGKSCVC